MFDRTLGIVKLCVCQVVSLLVGYVFDRTLGVVKLCIRSCLFMLDTCLTRTSYCKTKSVSHTLSRTILLELSLLFLVTMLEFVVFWYAKSQNVCVGDSVSFVLLIFRTSKRKRPQRSRHKEGLAMRNSGITFSTKNMFIMIRGSSSHWRNILLIRREWINSFFNYH